MNSDQTFQIDWLSVQFTIVRIVIIHYFIFFLYSRMDLLNASRKTVRPLTIAICWKRRTVAVKSAKVNRSQISWQFGDKLQQKKCRKKRRTLGFRFSLSPWFLFYILFFLLNLLSLCSMFSYFIRASVRWFVCVGDVFAMRDNGDDKNRMHLQRWTICKWCRMVWSGRSLCEFQVCGWCGYRVEYAMLYAMQ